MARNRSRSPDDDFRDEDVEPSSPEPEDVENDFAPKKKGSALPWFLLAVVVIFSASGGYLAFSTITELKNAVVPLSKAKDEATTKVQQLTADKAGLEAANKKLADQVTALETQLKEKDAKGAEQGGDSADDLSLAAPAKGSSKGKVASAKASKKPSHKKSHR